MVFLNCAVESYGNRMIRPKTDSAPESSVLEIVEFRHASARMGRIICPDVGR